MFRTTLMIVFAFSLTNIGLAEDRLTDLANREVESNSKKEALEIMQDHMRSQLDWRSYFTHRMNVRRRARLSEQEMREDPRAAATK